MTKIGIFWFYGNTVIGRARELSDGEENTTGLLDSPDSHIDLWENDPTFIIPFIELRDEEYQKTPRGRVIYSTQEQQTIVYMDKSLHTSKIKNTISTFFQLDKKHTSWKMDAHYTTDFDMINYIFDE